MKVTFKDSNLQYTGDEVIVLDLDYIPQVGGSVLFDQRIVPEIYLDYAKKYGFIIKAESAKNNDSYGTVRATVEYVSHVFKPQIPATQIGRTIIPKFTGHTVEIEINFESDHSNGTLGIKED